MPHFERAVKALRTLKDSDFVLMKSFQNPPTGVRLSLAAACIMMGVKPKMVKVEGSNVKKPDYWEQSRKLIDKWKKLLDNLINYPKENISPEIINKIQPLLNDPDFVPEKIKTASSAAEGICKWVIAICKFDIIYKEITPKR